MSFEPKDFSTFLEECTEDRIYNFCKDGNCSHCGNCCSTLLPMNRKEIKEIHRYIKNHNIQESKRMIPFVSIDYDLTCPFLDMNKSCKKCTIYPVRPQICKSFICNDEYKAKKIRKCLLSTRKIINLRDEFFQKKINIQ